MAKNTRNNTIFAKVSPPFGHPLSFDHMCIQYLNKSTLSLYSKPKFSRAILERNEVSFKSLSLHVAKSPLVIWYLHALVEQMKSDSENAFKFYID